jgi:hypothetical protein
MIDKHYDRWIVVYSEQEWAGPSNEKVAFFHPSDRKGAETFVRAIQFAEGTATLSRFKSLPLQSTTSTIAGNVI